MEILKRGRQDSGYESQSSEEDWHVKKPRNDDRHEVGLNPPLRVGFDYGICFSYKDLEFGDFPDQILSDGDDLEGGNVAQNDARVTEKGEFSSHFFAEGVTNSITNFEKDFKENAAGATNYIEMKDDCFMNNGGLLKEALDGVIEDTQCFDFEGILSTTRPFITDFDCQASHTHCQESHTVSVCEGSDTAGATNFSSTGSMNSGENSFTELLDVATPMAEIGLEHHSAPSPLSLLLKEAHMTQKYAVTNRGDDKPVVMTLDSLVELSDDIDWNSIEKLPLNQKQVEKVQGKIMGSKRSLAACENVIRGLALDEKWRELQNQNIYEKKKLNNMFSNFQRTDRKSGAGTKLYEEFVKKHGLINGDGYTAIEKKTGKSFGIFDEKGGLGYVSKNFKAGGSFFYCDGVKVYLVKNLKGFCRHF